MNFKQGLRTTDELTFWLDDTTDSGGVFGVLLDGVRYDGDTLSADNGYTGTVTVTVSPGTHTVQPLLDGVAVYPERSCKTAPAEGEYVKLLFSGDALTGEHGFHSMAYYESDADAFIATEMEYIDSNEYASGDCSAEAINTITEDWSATTTANGGEPAGETEIAVADATGFEVGKYVRIALNVAWHQSQITDITANVITILTPIPTSRSVANGAVIEQAERHTITTTSSHYLRYLASYREKYRCTLISAGGARREFYSRVPNYCIWDNHGIDTESDYFPKPGSAQWNAAAKAHWEHLSQINPQAEGDVDSVPSPGPFYFSHNIGSVQVIMLDMTAYNNDTTNPVLNSENNLTSETEWKDGRGDDKQWAWVQNEINNSTAKVLVIYHPKILVGTRTELVDSTNGILKRLSLKTDQAVILFTGDSHQPAILSHNIFDADILEFGCSPLQQTVISGVSSVGGAGTTTTLWNNSTSTPATSLYAGTLLPTDMNWVYAKLEYFPSGSAYLSSEHVAISMINAVSRDVIKVVRLPIGQSTPALAQRSRGAVTIY